jgi:hypothetical protein
MVLLTNIKTFERQGMKPQSSFTGSSAWLLGRSQSNSADRLWQRVRAVTKELEAIQHEMCSQLADSDGTPRKNAFVPGSAAGSDLHVFKTMVDQMRRILWFYTGNNIRPSEVEGAFNETLTSLGGKLSEQASDAGIEHASFFERLNVVIDGYIQAAPAGTPRRSKL